MNADTLLKTGQYVELARVIIIYLYLPFGPSFNPSQFPDGCAVVPPSKSPPPFFFKNWGEIAHSPSSKGKKKQNKANFS